MSTRTPERWQADLSDPTKPDTVLAHLACWCSFYAYNTNAKDSYRSVLGATSVLSMDADPDATRPAAYMFDIPECTIVVIAGTTDYTALFRQLIGTTKVRLVDEVPHLLVGYFWGNACKAIWAQFGTQILARSGTKKIVFTGHSLGGAIAACMYATFKRTFPEWTHQGTCYTFGAPRVGNTAVKTLTAESFAFSVPGDIVTKLPHKGYIRPAIQLPGLNQFAATPLEPFRNHGMYVNVEQDGKLWIPPDTLAGRQDDVGIEQLSLEALVGSTVPLASTIGGARTYRQIVSDGVENHYCQGYLDRLERALPPIGNVGDSLGNVGVIIEEKTLAGPKEAPVRISTWATQDPTPTRNDGVVPLVHRRHR